MDYSARIRKVAIVPEFARRLHTIIFQNFKTACCLIFSSGRLRLLSIDRSSTATEPQPNRKRTSTEPQLNCIRTAIEPQPNLN